MKTRYVPILLMTCALETPHALGMSIEEEVATVNTERLRALAAADLKGVEELFADDFVYVTANGKIETKEDFRRQVGAGYKLPFVEPQHLRVLVHGETAVVTYTTQRILQASQQPVHSISMCVYVRDGKAGWRLLSQQTNRIGQPLGER